MSDSIDSYIVDDTRDTINQFAAVCSKTASQKGFHQAFDDAEWLEALVADSDIPTVMGNRIKDIAERIRLLEIGMKSMLIVSEIAEGIESLRDTGYEGHLEGDGNWGEELADAGIRLGDLANMTKVALGDEIADKMTVNKGRPQLHGRKA